MPENLQWTRTDGGFRAEIGPGRFAVLRYSGAGSALYWTWSVSWDGAIVSGSQRDRQAAADAASSAVPEAMARAREVAETADAEKRTHERIDQLAAGFPLAPEELEFEDEPFDKLVRSMAHATARWAPSGTKSPVAMPVLETFMAALSAELARRRGRG